MKKKLCFILICMLTISMLVACGKTTTPVGSATPTATTESQTPSATQEPAKINKDVTLTVYGLTAPLKETLDLMCVEFEKETGIKVDWEIPPDQPYTVLKARFATGEGPDIFSMGNGAYEAWQDRCADLTGATWIEKGYESAIKPANVNGKQLGFPLTFEGNGIIYNKDIFAKAGIDKIPQTIDELEAVCKKLKQQGIQPFGEAYKEWGFLMHLFGIPFAYDEDIVTVNNKIKNGEMELKDLAYMDNLFRFYDLTLDYGLGAESIGFGAADQRESFAGGKSAMIKQGTWYTSLLKINPDLKMGIFAIPLDNDPSHTKFLTATTNYLAVNNDSPHVEEAKVFLEWVHKNMGTYFVEKLKVAPPYNDIELKDMGPLFNDMTEYTKKGMSFGYFGSEFWPDGFKTDIAAPLQAYAAKVMTKEQALAELQKAYMDRAAASK